MHFEDSYVKGVVIGCKNRWKRRKKIVLEGKHEQDAKGLVAAGPRAEHDGTAGRCLRTAGVGPSGRPFGRRGLVGRQEAGQGANYKNRSECGSRDRLDRGHEYPRDSRLSGMALPQNGDCGVSAIGGLLSGPGRNNLPLTLMAVIGRGTACTSYCCHMGTFRSGQFSGRPGGILTAFLRSCCRYRPADARCTSWL